jgi:hypothetical protein
MKKLIIMPILLLATAIQLNGAASAGAAALRRAGQQFVPQVQRATMSTSRSSLLAPRARVFGSQSARFQPLVEPAVSESQIFTCPAGMQQRYMASFWENPFTYSKRQAAEVEAREEARARQKAKDAREEERNRMLKARENFARNVAFNLFGFIESNDKQYSPYDNYIKLLEKLGSEMGTPKGRKLVSTVMQRDPEDYSVETVANLLTYPAIARKWLITPDGITLFSSLMSKNADVVRDKLSSLDYPTLYQILHAQGPAITDLAINDPTLDRAFDAYIKNAIKELVGYKYYENPFVAEFLTRNPQIAIMSAGDINNTAFNKIHDKPIAKPLFGAILSSPEASKILAKNVGWTKLEEWREVNMPEQLALPEAGQLALPAASEEVVERVDINE